MFTAGGHKHLQMWILILKITEVRRWREDVKGTFTKNSSFPWYMNDNLSTCTESCLFRPIETKSTFDFCLLHWLQPYFMVSYFPHWLCPVITVLYDPCRNYYICHSPAIFDILLLFVVWKGCFECLPFGDLCVMEKLFIYLSHTYTSSCSVTMSV